MLFTFPQFIHYPILGMTRYTSSLPLICFLLHVTLIWWPDFPSHWVSRGNGKMAFPLLTSSRTLLPQLYPLLPHKFSLASSDLLWSLLLIKKKKSLLTLQPSAATTSILCSPLDQTYLKELFLFTVSISYPYHPHSFFCPHHPTNRALVTVIMTSLWTAKPSDHFSELILLDLSAGFDTDGPSLLFELLPLFGFPNTPLLVPLRPHEPFFLGLLFFLIFWTFNIDWSRFSTSIPSFPLWSQPILWHARMNPRVLSLPALSLEIQTHTWPLHLDH